MEISHKLWALFVDCCCVGRYLGILSDGQQCNYKTSLQSYTQHKASLSWFGDCCERKVIWTKVINKMALAPNVISGPSTSTGPNKSTKKNVLIPDDYEPVPVSYIDVGEGRRVAYRKFEGHLQPTILYIPGMWTFDFNLLFRQNDSLPLMTTGHCPVDSVFQT